MQIKRLQNEKAVFYISKNKTSSWKMLKVNNRAATASEQR